MSEQQKQRFDVRIVSVYESDTLPQPHERFALVGVSMSRNPSGGREMFLYHVALYTEQDE